MKNTNILYYSILLCICSALGLSSCIKTDIFVPEKCQRVELIYCAGDNVLSSDLKQVVELIRQSWLYTGNRCAIYFDPIDDVPTLISIRGGCPTIPDPVIEELKVYEEHNSASPEVLSEVIKTVRELYPLGDMGLIFSSTGSGWIPSNNAEKSIGSDNNQGSEIDGAAYMNLEQFANAIDDNEFEYIIFEADFMAGIEVAYSLRNKSKYVMASATELLDGGFNKVYIEAHRHLMNTKIPTEKALSEFGNTYTNYLDSKSENTHLTAMSVIKTNLLEELSAVVKKAKPYNTEQWTDVSSIQNFDPKSQNHLFFDFEQYVQSIGSEQETEQISSLINQAVIWKYSTNQNKNSIKHFCGLSTYIPQSQLQNLNDAYKLTEWHKSLQL